MFFICNVKLLVLRYLRIFYLLFVYLLLTVSIIASVWRYVVYAFTSITNVLQHFTYFKQRSRHVCIHRGKGGNRPPNWMTTVEFSVKYLFFNGHMWMPWRVSRSTPFRLPRNDLCTQGRGAWWEYPCDADSELKRRTGRMGNGAASTKKKTAAALGTKWCASPKRNHLRSYFVGRRTGWQNNNLCVSV